LKDWLILKEIFAYLFICKTFLLAHISCTGGFIMTLLYILTCALVRFSHTVSLPHPSLPYLKSFQQISSFNFISICPLLHLMKNKPYFFSLKTRLSLFVNCKWPLRPEAHFLVIYFHIWKKTCDLCIYEPGLLCLTVPSIDWRTTKVHSSL
jgi:hypothetical protein